MRNYRTFGDLEEGYLRDHPEEIDDYLSILFEEYAQSGDTEALLSSLQAVSRVKGVNLTIRDAGVGRKGLQKAVAENGNTAFTRVNTLLHALGYRLMPQKLEASAPVH